MSILTVNNLCKDYGAFALDNVSFDLEPGKITGFIGRNGAGKTTTIKSMFDFVHPDSGVVKFFDMDFKGHEKAIKERIGFVSGGFGYYSSKKLKTITNVTASFYNNFDFNVYQKYMAEFALDDSKTPAKLSEGMKVKYSLALAMSHHAEILILDEPTSGIDPISRDELLDIFMDLADGGTTIFFSTHITSDLDKCADNIIYIKNGRIIAEDNLENFVQQYRTVGITGMRPEAVEAVLHDAQTERDVEMQADAQTRAQAATILIGTKRSKTGAEALIHVNDVERFRALWDAKAPTTDAKVPTLDADGTGTSTNNIEIKDADLESIMIHFEKGEL